MVARLLSDYYPVRWNSKSCRPSPTLVVTYTSTFTFTVTPPPSGSYMTSRPEPSCTIQPSDCAQLSRDYDRTIASIMKGESLKWPDEPFCILDHKDCERCTIFGSTVQLLYFPTGIGGPNRNLCETASPVKRANAEIQVETLPSAISSLRFPYYGADENIHSFNYDDLNGDVPWSAYAGISMDQKWANCGLDWRGLLDPPRALTVLSSLDDPATTPEVKTPIPAPTPTPADSPKVQGTVPASIHPSPVPQSQALSIPNPNVETAKPSSPASPILMPALSLNPPTFPTAIVVGTSFSQYKCPSVTQMHRFQKWFFRPSRIRRISFDLKYLSYPKSIRTRMDSNWDGIWLPDLLLTGLPSNSPATLDGKIFFIGIHGVMVSSISGQTTAIQVPPSIAQLAGGQILIPVVFTLDTGETLTADPVSGLIVGSSTLRIGDPSMTISWTISGGMMTKTITLGSVGVVVWDPWTTAIIPRQTAVGMPVTLTGQPFSNSESPSEVDSSIVDIFDSTLSQQISYSHLRSTGASSTIVTETLMSSSIKQLSKSGSGQIQNYNIVV
ncbi:hypothetical protein K469DRAFT_688146 [Zopfia rhizophila CBS 207.26]|uniref:Uncharacterized protein n=1 Tax=Zopfia rhizophila CBS 207.26 TaxID=1314779 RepID=A0A6A6E0A1_9PEZI|nr:hypothetical protein K469DRAFT_688146 [Zopfia rhizophila CBS 207.26]